MKLSFEYMKTLKERLDAIEEEGKKKGSSLDEELFEGITRRDLCVFNSLISLPLQKPYKPYKSFEELKTDPLPPTKKEKEKENKNKE